MAESSRACLVKLQLFRKELLYERAELQESIWGASNKADSLYLQRAGKPVYIPLDWTQRTAKLANLP